MRTDQAHSQSIDLAEDSSSLAHLVLATLEKSHEVYARCVIGGQKANIMLPVLRQPSAKTLRDKMLRSSASAFQVEIQLTDDGVLTEKGFIGVIAKLKTGCCGECVVVYDNQTFVLIGG